MQNKKGDERLVIPPKKWRSSASLRGYAGQLKAEIARAKAGMWDDLSVKIEPKTAQALVEIICQAIHTEQVNGA